ncbi:MAG TPA: hypothetical protein VFV92_05075, partial [Candidatus Bathyarchaeia archaeon]|nr:hypothetical protein [Candidatus Bathyarchaeia archaeon]
SPNLNPRPSSAFQLREPTITTRLGLLKKLTLQPHWQRTPEQDLSGKGELLGISRITTLPQSRMRDQRD